MRLEMATSRLQVALSNEDGDSLSEVLGNLAEGTCDAA
jgi:hypothetical protein